MVITLVLYIVLAIATATAIRPHYATPVTVSSGLADGARQQRLGDQRPREGAERPAAEPGRPCTTASSALAVQRTVENSANSNAFTTWLTKHGYTSWTSLQPDSRFWEFQLIEGGWLSR